MKSKVLLALLVILILIQFIQIDKTNPTIISTKDFMQIETLTDSEKLLLKNACMDCHSHETTFPSYTKVQPLGWWVRSHIRGGRINLNFSEWADYSEKQKSHKLEECVEVLEQNRMPLKSYTWMHPKSKLSEAQSEELKSLFQRL